MQASSCRLFRETMRTSGPQVMTSTMPYLGAICFAIAGFTCWVLCDSAIKLAGQSQLPNYEIVAFLGIFMVGVHLALRAFGKERRGSSGLSDRSGGFMVRASLDVINNLCVVVALQTPCLSRCSTCPRVHVTPPGGGSGKSVPKRAAGLAEGCRHSWLAFLAWWSPFLPITVQRNKRLDRRWLPAPPVRNCLLDRRWSGRG